MAKVHKSTCGTFKTRKKNSEKGNTQGPFLKVKTTDADLIYHGIS